MKMIDLKVFGALKNKPMDFEEFKFVLFAMGFSVNFSTNCICIKGKQIIATDGKRLHKATVKGDYESGFYGVLKNLSMRILLYKIEEETPSAQIPLYNEILFPRSDYIIAKRSKVLRTAFSIYSLGDTMVNTHFLGDTMSFKDEWHVCIDKSCRKIRLDSGNFTAILPATMMTKIKIFKV